MPMSRRARPLFILLFTLVCGPFAAWAQTPTCPSGSNQATLVQPPAGSLCGNAVTVGNTTVYEYLGIPYAQPPVGGLRWKNPQPYPSWSGDAPRAAIRFGSRCPQPPGPDGCPADITEDCLYLNVWVPVPSSQPLPTNLPVMVFIHGGAFIVGSSGSSTSDLLDGRSLAARGNVIVVTFNYRLGTLGFLVNSRITDATNNNFGFRDQILALQWVQKNIAGFGGDASQVTLFGESAGAMSVGLHALSSTQSAGLFNRALMESNPLGLPYKNMTHAATMGRVFADVMGCYCPWTMKRCMRKKTACQLVTGEASKLWSGYLIFFAGKAQNLLAFAPAIEDPKKPLPHPILQGQPLANIDRLGVPMVLGTNHDEGYLFAQLFLLPLKQKVVTLEDYKGVTKDLFGSKADTVRMSPVYGCSASPCTTQVTQILTDYLFTCANRYFARHAPATNDTYIYQFNEVTANPSCNVWPGLDCAGPDSFVCHANELPYVFDTPGNFPKCSFGSGPQGVSNAMEDYWTSFAHGKAPATALSGWPTPWPAFLDTGGSQYLLISESPSIASDPLDAQANCSSFWDSQIGYELPTTWSRMLTSAAAKP